jgi:hypothetical protein
LCKVGDYLNLETIDLQKAEVDADDSHTGSHVYRFYNAYSFNWPYFAYATRFTDLFLLNAFNQDFVQCYEMPKNIHFVVETFITDTKDFFCIAETTDNHFELFQVDLDDPNPRLRSIHRYTFDEVHGNQVNAFHCRGSSHKEKVDLNEKLVIYIMHGNDLYCWVQGNKKLDLVDSYCSHLYYMSDNTMFYLHSPPVK